LARLDRLIRSYRPDWIVCTHSLPLPRLSRVRSRLQGFRIAVVVTDQYPHLMWRRGNPDHYFVPSAWTRDLLEARSPGTGPKTTVTGIPIDPLFAAGPCRSSARREMELPQELPVVLLTSGGIGGGPFVEVVRALSAIPIECLVVAVCGRNQSAYERVAACVPTFTAGSHVRFRAEGHLPQTAMAALMHASDFVIGKPGGVTMSECLACGCPMLIYRPFMIPGQEEGNARLLEQVGAGMIASDLPDLITKTALLLERPERLAAMRERSLQAASPHAAENIVRLLCEL
jgi:processive 1,2-diacylglycerol beta-glucosyltransferase